MPRGKRGQAIAVGIYPDADGDGFEVRATAAGQQESKRFPGDASVRSMQAWQEDKRSEFRKLAREREQLLKSGTLAGDVAAFLLTLTKAERAQVVALLDAWLTPDLMKRLRRKIKLADLRAQVVAWVDAGVAPSTINHRRRALIKVYEFFDGTDVPVLPRRLKRVTEATPLPRAVSMELLVAILDHARGFYYGERGEKKATPSTPQIRLLLWTGMPPAVLRRLEAHHLDLVAKEITKPGRQKGRGSPAVTLPLIDPEGVAAARGWLDAGSPKARKTPALRQAWLRMVEAYRRDIDEGSVTPPAPLPEHIRLYDLRHSFLTWLARKTKRELIVSHYGQVDLRTARRYILAAMGDLTREALGVALPSGTRTENTA